MSDLRALAKAATPGPWFDAGDQVYAGQGETYSDIADIHGDMDVGNQSANAAYIAAASPDRILALLDKIDRAADDAARKALRKRFVAILDNSWPLAGKLMAAVDEYVDDLRDRQP